MMLQLTPEELLALYKSLLLNGGFDDASAALLQKIESSILGCLVKQEDARNLDAYETWIETENQKISTLKDELKEIAKGTLLVEKKTQKTTTNKPLSKRGRPKKV